MTTGAEWSTWLCEKALHGAELIDGKLPELESRGGPFAHAAGEMQKVITDLRRVCGPCTLRVIGDIDTQKLAVLVRNMAFAISVPMNAAENEIASAPGWEPEEEPDDLVLEIDSRVNGIISHSMQAQDWEYGAMVTGGNLG